MYWSCLLGAWPHFLVCHEYLSNLHVHKVMSLFIDCERRCGVFMLRFKWQNNSILLNLTRLVLVLCCGWTQFAEPLTYVLLNFLLCTFLAFHFRMCWGISEPYTLLSFPVLPIVEIVDDINNSCHLSKSVLQEISFTRIWFVLNVMVN